MPSGYNVNLPADVLLDQGLLYIGAVLVGATKDALRFNPNREIRNLPFAGKKSAIAGLDRVTGWAPVIEGTLLEFGTFEVGMIEPGAASVVAGGITTWTPGDAGVLIPSASLLTDVRAIWPRGGGGFADVIFPKAIVLTWGMEGEDPGEVGIPIEIAARLDMSVGGAVTEDAPYRVRHLAAI